MSPPSGHVYLDALGEETHDRVFYEGCQWLPVRRALRSVGLGPRDVLADLGSGKGQALLIAGREPIARVIGVELLDELTVAARANVAAARGRLRAGSVETVTADVLEWPVPEDLSVVFLYCPFTGSVFHRAMERIFESYDADPRPLHIVYSYPWEHDWLISSGRVRLETVLPAQWPTNPWWWQTGWVITVYARRRGPGRPGVPGLSRRLFRPRRAVERWSRPNDTRFFLTRDGEEVASSRS